MPEIKHQFTGGKMNKDVDPRLVPKGEYRDAMNIQVSTSDGSDVGTVQNILGNVKGCSNALIPPSSFTVGSIADEKNDTLYWLVSGQYYGASEMNWNQFSHASDMIVRKTPTNVCEPVFVDKFAFTVSSDTSINLGMIDQLSGMPTDLTSEIEPGWTVTGLTADGDTSNTVEILEVAYSPEFAANLGMTMIHAASRIVVPVDNTGAMTAGNILYLDDYNASYSYPQLIGSTIELFDPSHPDYQTNTVVGTQIVSFTIVQVQPFPQAALLQSVSYVEFTLQNPLTPFTNNLVPAYTTTGDILSSSYDGSIIWGELTNTIIGDIPIPNNLINHTMSGGLSVGSPIAFGPFSGCIGAMNTATQFTLVECSTGVPMAVPSTTFNFTLPLNTTISLNESLNLNAVDPLHESLIFEKPRVLNFNHDEYITGINIIDNMLFWTDGKTEPKKINISRSIEGTGPTMGGYNHTRLIVEGSEKGPVKEEHIAVIRRAPLRPPHLELKTTAREGITSGDSVETINAVAPFLGLMVGQEKTLEFADVLGDSFGFKNGDIMLLSDDILNLPASWEIRASIKSVVSIPGTTSILVKIESMVPSTDTTEITWYGHLEEEKSLFQRKLPRFAYRYKYEDGEYSSFSPFTQVAFVPGGFNYQPIEAYNTGMVNSIKSLKVQNFVTPDMPLDVVSVDLLYKNETNPSVYLLKSISPNDGILQGKTTNYWNDSSGPLLTYYNKGSYEVSSENVTSMLPSSQSLRVWDNVPKRALAQEMTGNRVIYGNYTQGYDSIQPDVEAYLGSRAIDTNTNIGERSVKSLRDYDIGVVWGDKYGRETPVKSSGSSGSIVVPKSRSISSNYINVDLKNSPDWAEYYRVYIKETSNEYYNLAVDRVYDAEDGNIWVSFPSVDRNKVDEDTYIILKKGVESDDLVGEEARYKIVAIENEAPEYIKTTYERLARTNTDDSRAKYSCNMYGGSNPCDATVGFPGGGKNAPVVGMKGFSIAAGHWTRDYSTIHDPNNSIYLGMGLTSPKVLFDEVVGNSSGSTTDELYVSFSKEVNVDGVTSVTPVSRKYHVVNVDVSGFAAPHEGFFYINLDTPIASEDEWITENHQSNVYDNIHIHFWKKTIINKPEFDGRFFVKILGGENVTDRLTKKVDLVNDLMIFASTSLYKIEDAEAGNFAAAGEFLYNHNGSTYNPQGLSDTNSRGDWENLLKFGGSSRKGAWFIDKATFASRQSGAQNLPSNGLLPHDSVITSFPNPSGAMKPSCQLVSSVEQTFSADCQGYVLGTFTHSDSISQSIGTGYSLARFGMKGVWEDGGDKYIDIAYSQLGPDGVSSATGYDHRLDWRVGDTGNTTSDQEVRVVGSLKPKARFRLGGGDVVYKIKSINKFRLFNYAGKVTIDTSDNQAGHGFNYPPSWMGNNILREGLSAACGYFTNDKYPGQATRMENRTNRRVTYRIKYEIDDLFTPDGSTVSTIGDDPAYGSVTNTTAVSLQFLTDFTAEGENPISKDPAIFETEPKEDVDIDIYYEASSSLATLPLTNKNKHLFIPSGSTIVRPVNSIFPEGIFITSWGSINPFSPQYTIYLSSEITDSDLTLLTSEETCYAEKDNGEIVSFKVISGNFDFVTQKYPSLRIEPRKEVGLNWFNCWSFNNGVESNRIGDTFNKPYITNGATASSSTEELKEEETRKNGLIYSGIYNSTSGTNDLNQFIAAEKITKDINPIYGGIQKLHSGWGQGGDLIALCEDRVLKILANKDALYNADGNANVTSTNNVLGQAIPYSGEYGISKNPESFASDAYRAYFTDKVRGTVMRLSMDGLTPISSHGMKDWFRDHLKLGDKLIGSYDDKKDEYNITIKGDTVAKTVTFKEDVKGWVSFKSFTPENAISCANEYYTFKDGSIWKHHNEFVDRNTFYGTDPQHYTNSSVEVIFNEVPGSVKSFKTVNYEGSQAKVTSKDENGVTLVDGEYFNLSDAKGWHVDNVVTNLEQGGITDFVNKEGKWFGYVTGNDVTINPTGNVSGNYDTEDFSIQGVGKAASSVSSVVYGCTDPTMFNYSAAVTSDDGSCIAFNYGCTDGGASNFSVAANTDDGSCFLYGCMQGPLATWSNQTSSDPNFNLSGVAGSTNFNSNATVELPGSCETAIYGCTISGNFNFNPLANVSGSLLGDGSFCGYTDCMCIPLIYGCTDPSATTYAVLVNEMQDINTEDGSCMYSGCTDPLAENYDLMFSGSAVDGPNGILTYLNGTADDDGSCTYVGGCTDPLACNYDALATQDNGSCSYCGDPNAENYTAPNNPSCDLNCEYCAPISNIQVLSQTTSDFLLGVDQMNGTAVVSFSEPANAYGVHVTTTSGLFFIDQANTYTPSTGWGSGTITFTATGLGVGTINQETAVQCGANSTGNQWASLTAGIVNPFLTITTTQTPIPGCTDNTGAGACNYDNNATTDDGSCEYVTCTGCNDNAYLEYCGDCWDVVGQVVVASGGTDWVADTIPTSCTTLIVSGCTDATAFNYDASANTDDGTCVAVVNGCMDSTLNNDGTYAASNYAGPPTGTANTADNSCLPYGCPLGPNITANSSQIQIGFNVQSTTYSNQSNYSGYPNDFIVGLSVFDSNGSSIFTNSPISGFLYTSTTSPLIKTVSTNQVTSWTQGETSITVTSTVDSNDGLCSISQTAIFTVGCMHGSAFNYDPTWDLHDITQCTYSGCTDPTACNYDAAVTIDDGSCTSYGCTDSNAVNYDANATCDDGTCNYLGCTNPTSFNYDSNATIDDGSCIAVVNGCTDATAFNYDAAANTDIGSCIYEGCTDATATNYDASANQDDGSCIAANPGCMDATATNYDAAFNQDCTYTGSTYATDCCCYTCSTPTWATTDSIVVVDWDVLPPTTPAYATQVTFSFNVVNTASLYTITVLNPANSTSISIGPFTPGTPIGTLTSFTYLNSNSSFFENEVAYTFTLVAHCENEDGVACSNSHGAAQNFTIID